MLLLVWFSPLSIVAWLLGPGGDLAPAPLALVALHPRQPRLDRRGAGRDRPRAGPAPAHLRAPALLAVRRPALRLRPPRHPDHRRPVPLGPGRHPGVAGRPGRAAGRLACRCGTPSGPPAGPSGAPSSAAASASTSAPATARPPGWSPDPATTSSPPRPSGSPWTATWRSWRQGRYVVPPAQLRGKAMAVVGAPGRRQDRHPAPPRLPGRACWVARSASSTARAPTPPWSRP